MKRRALATLALCLVLGACSDGGGEPPDTGGGSPSPPKASRCGFPKPKEGARISVVPADLVPEGSELTRVTRGQGREVGSFRVPLGVQATFDVMKKAVASSDYELLQEDNEGFEAELYLKRGKDLAQVVIRRSTCDDQSALFLNFPKSRTR